MEYRDGNWGSGMGDQAGKQANDVSSTQSQNLLMKTRLEEAAIGIRQQAAREEGVYAKFALNNHAEMLFTAAKLLGEGEDRVRVLETNLRKSQEERAALFQVIAAYQTQLAASEAQPGICPTCQTPWGV